MKNSAKFPVLWMALKDCSDCFYTTKSLLILKLLKVILKNDDDCSFLFLRHLKNKMTT